MKVSHLAKTHRLKSTTWKMFHRHSSPFETVVNENEMLHNLYDDSFDNVKDEIRCETSSFA